MNLRFVCKMTLDTGSIIGDIHVYTINRLFAAYNFCNLAEDYQENKIPETFKYWFAEKFSCT